MTLEIAAKTHVDFVFRIQLGEKKTPSNGLTLLIASCSMFLVLPPLGKKVISQLFPLFQLLANIHNPTALWINWWARCEWRDSFCSIKVLGENHHPSGTFLLKVTLTFAKLFSNFLQRKDSGSLNSRLFIFFGASIVYSKVQSRQTRIKRNYIFL